MQNADHLGDEKYGDSQPAHGNARNGTTPTRLKGQHGKVDMFTPKDREGSVEPQWVRKHQTVRIRPQASDRQNQTRLTLDP